MTCKCLPFLVCIAALISPLAAEEKKAGVIEMRLLAFQPDKAVEEVFAHDPSGPPGAVAVKTPLKSYLNHEFSTVGLSSRRIIFTNSKEKDSLNRNESLLGEVTLPEGIHSAILLFLPAKEGGKFRFQILPINDSKQAFPAGTFRVSNLSPQPVRIVLEETNYDFKPGQSDFIKDPPVREGNQSGMKAYAFHDNVWQRIGSGIWPHPGENRVVQILFIHPTTGQVQLRAFDDVPPR